MRTLEEQGMSREQAFLDVFKCKYASSTWSDNHRAWKAAASEERARWVRYGRTLEGEWAEFYRKWKRRR